MNDDLKLNMIDLLAKIDELKSEIDKFHPLPQEVEDRIFQKYRLDWNYNSNAIEGNTLNYGETYAFLMHGITASGKPLKDYLDIRGHNEAINYLINFVRKKEELTEAVIRELHKVILVESYEIDAITQNGKPTKKTVTLGAYKTQPNHVKTATGEIHYFASPEDTPAKMHELINWYRESREKKEIHPVVLAALFHHRFSEIHPFDDGNGRLARLLMNLILMQNNFPPAIIKIKDRNNYYLALSQADAGDSKKFVEYVAETLMKSMEVYLKGARGESIEEPGDVDKELHLFKKEFDASKSRVKKTNTFDTKLEVTKFFFETVINKLEIALKKFHEFFFETTQGYMLSLPNGSGGGRSELDQIRLDELSKEMKMNGSFYSVKFTFFLKKFKSSINPISIKIEYEIYFEDFDFKIYCWLDHHPFNESPNINVGENLVVLLDRTYNYDNYSSLTGSEKLVTSLSNEILRVMRIANK